MLRSGSWYVSKVINTVKIQTSGTLRCFWTHPDFFCFVLFFLQLVYGEPVLHEYIRHGVGQPQADQASSDEHRRRHEDGDGFGDADERPENQVPQHRGQFTQGVAEAKARSSAG